MSLFMPGTPQSVIDATNKKMGIPIDPFDSNVAVQIGNSSGSATDGLGQIDKGSQTVGTALQRAQQANKASSEAIGGGGKNPMGGVGVAGITGSGDFGGLKKTLGMKKGGKVKAYAKGGSVSSASSRGDGIAQRGKTRGRMC
jgi:hypothetical protein